MPISCFGASKRGACAASASCSLSADCCRCRGDAKGLPVRPVSSPALEAVMCRLSLCEAGARKKPGTGGGGGGRDDGGRDSGSAADSALWHPRVGLSLPGSSSCFPAASSSSANTAHPGNLSASLEEKSSGRLESCHGSDLAGLGCSETESLASAGAFSPASSLLSSSSTARCCPTVWSGCEAPSQLPPSSLALQLASEPRSLKGSHGASARAAPAGGLNDIVTLSV